MDILGPLPQTPRSNRYILVISDYFSEWVEAFPKENMEALMVAKILVNEFITRFGVPEVIHTDQLTRGEILSPPSSKTSVLC